MGRQTLLVPVCVGEARIPLKIFRIKKGINQVRHDEQGYDETNQILQFHDGPSHRRSHPAAYRQAMAKKTTVMTMKIRSAISAFFVSMFSF